MTDWNIIVLTSYIQISFCDFTEIQPGQTLRGFYWMCPNLQNKMAVEMLTLWPFKFHVFNQLVRIQETPAHSTLSDRFPSSASPTALGAAGRGLPASFSLSRHCVCVCARCLNTRWEVLFVHKSPGGLLPLLTQKAWVLCGSLSKAANFQDLESEQTASKSESLIYQPNHFHLKAPKNINITNLLKTNLQSKFVCGVKKII